MRRSLLVAALTVAAASAQAQTQQVLFPGQSGQELLASIRAEYRPASLSGNNDDLYARVDSTTVGGQKGVVGVYTGLFVPFDCTPNCDPSQDVFNGGGNGNVAINQEHTWPQSLLDTQAKSDLHNLFPTQVGVNADRANDRFAEIPDAQATRWYRGAPPYNQTSPPDQNRSEYSEILRVNDQTVSFEPREDHKGNVARALFYMATVYSPATNSDFPFDATDQRTLYEWHYQDAITAADQSRSGRVAQFQSGKDNPFVLDSTLARRAFFPQIAVAAEDDAPAAGRLAVAGSNPFTTEAQLTLTLAAPADVRAHAFDALGRRVAVLWDGPAPAGPTALRLNGAGLAAGVYAVRVTAGGAILTRRLVRIR